jgi:hypothetical protein
MEDKTEDIVKHSMDFFNEFNTKVSQCKDTDEYCALVASIFLFNKLVISSFKSGFLRDSSAEELETFLGVLNEQAEVMSKQVIDNWNKTNLH